MDDARKWLLVSPSTGEVLALSLEECRRLLLWPPGDRLLAELEAAEAEARRTGADAPVAGPVGEEWLVAAPGPRR